MEALPAPWPAAVAVSGGADSLALMHLLARWAHARALPPPIVLTVDHGLLPDSALMARKVVFWARAAGLKAVSLAWKGKKPPSDIEAAAREARYRLMRDWLESRGLKALYVAHTEDDQAETFLLRLARGSGLDGLSAMQELAAFPVPSADALRLVRPLLSFSRTALRQHLTSQRQAWIEDPMNVDPRFARARIRAAWPALEALGLERARIADAAAHMSRAREALDWATLAVARRAVRLEDGVAAVDSEALVQAPREVALRLLARLLMVLGGQSYRPRFESLERLFDSIARGSYKTATLHGCIVATAPRAKAVFGSATILIRPEAKRRLRRSS
jgi:tRNA(Ile)-lysidine synthase